MRFSYLLVVVVHLLLSFSSATLFEKRTSASYDGQADALAAQGLKNLVDYTASHGFPSQKCNLTTAAVRREWGALSIDERKNYTAAVNCLAKKAARTPSSVASGARNRYDDFVVTHIIQTPSVHGTGNFLAWHRYFVWAYEQALRNECGYTGYQPYWNWGKYVDDPISSPIFDGSDASMSGNGVHVAHETTCVAPGFCLPAGNGGGCISSGPFKDFKVNLGPVFGAYSDVKPNPQSSGLGYNPRCIRRDISAYAAKSVTDAITVDLIKNNPDPYWFITNMQGDFPRNYLGIHAGGHAIFTGDPGGDIFVSLGDPVFWLHHSMIDRVWWTWQNLDIPNRQYSISGGTSMFDFQHTSPNATLDDAIDLGVNGDPITNRDAMSTIAGPFCYIYA
ncbi:putative tyrosinase [Crepidotus variabilis]|uniref:Tyrosinase n=1 Tax=Crepidotus variabilis TaxID=179855 RepID=A0A9P6EHV7_9AGAR|nr:putative tyrosinase [Crepidotus variabilis]